MAKKKKGPRQSVGLKCAVCGNFNYITEYNKNNDVLMKQTKGSGTFDEIKKHCSTCKKHTIHKQSKKLK